jgi:hypothetical protein
MQQVREMTHAYKILGGKPDGKSPLRGPRRRCKNTTVKPAKTVPPIYRKPGQTENKFRNGVISYVK